MARGNRQEGFVLIATLWFVAVLALVTIIISSWVSNALERAGAHRNELDAHAQEISVADRIAFLMATNYFSTRGLELSKDQGQARVAFLGDFDTTAPGAAFIALDDRLYRLGNDVVQLQDSGGLLNLKGQASLVNLLKVYGVDHQDSAALVDRLLDYAQPSAGTQLDGATNDDYASAGRPPPRGAPLLTPWEPLRVLGWDAYPALWSGQAPLSEVVTIGSSNGINLATAPATVLRSLPGMDDAAVARWLSYRATDQIVDAGNFQHVTNVLLTVDLQTNYFPASSLRLTETSPTDPLLHQIEIRLTPLDRAPYRIDYAVDLPKPTAYRSIDLNMLPSLPVATAP